MRIKTAVAFLVLFVTLGQAAASFDELEIGVASQAMGGTGVVLSGPGSVLFNPASIAGMGGTSAVISGRLPFSSLDFGTYGLDAALPLAGEWSAGLSLRSFGGDLYSEQMAAVTFAGMLTDDMSFGLQPVICRAEIAEGVSEYGSATAFAVNTGFQVRMYSRWILAASIRNPFQARVGESGEYLKRRIDAGLRYEPSRGMMSALTLSRDFNGTRLHLGQSLPLGAMTLMAGVQSSPVTVSGGLGTIVRGIQLDYAVISHPKLDLTHQFGVRYDF